MWAGHGIGISQGNQIKPCLIGLDPWEMSSTFDKWVCIGQIFPSIIYQISMSCTHGIFWQYKMSSTFDIWVSNVLDISQDIEILKHWDIKTLRHWDSLFTPICQMYSRSLYTPICQHLPRNWDIKTLRHQDIKTLRHWDIPLHTHFSNILEIPIQSTHPFIKMSNVLDISQDDRWLKEIYDLGEVG